MCSSWTDAQFFAGKEGLQEEFFHTFNTLYETRSLLVITCDRPPDSIPTLEDRLRSRFKMGLITDVQPPNIETRLAILDHRVPMNAATFSRTRCSISLPSGSPTTSVNSKARSPGSARSPRSTDRRSRCPPRKTSYANLFTPQKQQIVTPVHILTACSTMFGISIDDIIGTSRRRQLVTARHIAMYVMRDLTDLSFPAIAAEFGDRDHTTVIHAVNKIKQLMSNASKCTNT